MRSTPRSLWLKLWAGSSSTLATSRRIVVRVTSMTASTNASFDGKCAYSVFLLMPSS
jgi:hypothetical protein